MGIAVDTTDRLTGHLTSTLVDARSGPLFGTPCGVLAPLLRALDSVVGVHTIPREDSAVGLAAGAALAGATPVVLMQNSGFGQSVNAYASLVVPYGLDVLTVVSMRGIPPDDTEENAAMGRLTPSIVTGLGADSRRIDHDDDVDDELRDWMCVSRSAPRFLLIAPGLLGWRS